MVSKDISFVIPVFNRPNEIDELLRSFVNLSGEKDFEIVIVEDGSINICDQVIKNYEDLKISYYFKKNSGPGDSRNFGMKRAKGSYYIILDSDFPRLLIEVNLRAPLNGVGTVHENILKKEYYHLFQVTLKKLFFQIKKD